MYVTTLFTNPRIIGMALGSCRRVARSQTRLAHDVVTVVRRCRATGWLNVDVLKR